MLTEPPSSPTPSAPPPPLPPVAPPQSVTHQQYGQYAPPPPLVHVAPQQFVQYAQVPQYVQYAPQPQPQPQSHSQGHYATGLPVQSTAAPWSTGLCDCFSDVPNCCLTCWCPCITFGQIAEIVDKGSTTCGVHGTLYALINLLSGCGCIYSCIYRVKMRRQFVLKERPCNDCLVHCFCGPCALCQEYRELQHHGFDISIGWEGNEERSRGMSMPPVVHGAMTR